MVGPITISLLVDSLKFGVTVSDVTYTFLLDVQHCVVNIMTFDQIADISYVINSGPQAEPFNAVSWTNLDCLYAATYSITSISGAATSVPAWLVLDGTALTITYDAKS